VTLFCVFGMIYREISTGSLVGGKKERRGQRMLHNYEWGKEKGIVRGEIGGRTMNGVCEKVARCFTSA